MVEPRFDIEAQNNSEIAYCMTLCNQQQDTRMFVRVRERGVNMCY